MEIQYTKINLIHEVNNDKVHNFYYVYYGRIYNDSKTKYKKFRYVLWFDIYDVQDFLGKEVITKKDIREYAEGLECGYLLNIKDYNDKEGLKEFYSFCRQSIEDYNNLLIAENGYILF